MVEKIYNNRKLYTTIILMVAVVLMTITNYTRVFQGGEPVTRALFWNSEFLVYGEMLLSYQPQPESVYGLSDMYPYNGTQEGGLSENGFARGYSETEKKIAVHDNENTGKQFVIGNTIVFFNGDKAEIVEVSAKDGYLYVTYDAEEIYSFDIQGDLRYACVYNNVQERYMQPGNGIEYESQIGLQGAIFSMFPKTMTIGAVTVIYKWALSFLFAAVISLISYGIYKKYNIKFAIVFYLVTLLSPWMIGYAVNLYWVPFTWFLPMLFGIYCANHIDSKKARVISYIGVMVSIFIKCACGYEFITTIMMSSIVFLLTDFVMAFLEKDNEKTKKLFKIIFVMGIFALAGFAIALIWHAYLRGGGNIVNGMRSIYLNDILRRTLGGDPNMFQDVYADSLTAPIYYVVARYLLFDTPLILGVPGILFIPLIAVSFLTMVYFVKKEKCDKEMIVLYIWLGIAGVSWFVLGKSHSYIHTGMNFAMWYFGFMQIVFYLIWEAVYFAIQKLRKK